MLLPHSARYRGTLVSVLGSLVVLMLILSGCASGQLSEMGTEQSTDPYRKARAQNLNHHVSNIFEPTPEVIADEDRSGVEVAQRFFDTSSAVVVSSGDISAQLRAASLAVVTHAPMLTMNENNRQAVVSEINRLGAQYVLSVGDVPLANTAGDTNVIVDPGGLAALGTMTSLQFYPKQITYADKVVAAVAALEPEHVSYLIPGWFDDDTKEKLLADAHPQTTDRKQHTVAAFPVQSKRDADMSPVVIASEQSSIAAVATARAFGAAVRTMPLPDPRFSRETMRMVAGLANAPLIALGAQFGSAQQLRERISIGENITTEIAGGGGLVFPQRALIMKHVPLSVEATAARSREENTTAIADAVVMAKKQASAFARTHVGTVVPGLEIALGNVFALDTQQPSFSPELVAHAVNEMVAQHGYIFLRITPYAGKLVEQLARIEDMLSGANVSVIIDMDSAEQPIEAQELNRAISWLARLCEDKKIPQKTLVIAQSSVNPIADAAHIDTDSAYVSVTIVAEFFAEGNYGFVSWEEAKQRFGQIVAGYQQTGKNFYYGWVVDNVLGQARRSTEENFFSSAEFSQLSPYPWLILG
ncbi:hypothetical protein [Corynebacterium sp. sy039]|uniref:hypothetical protein n=1 Tax=Corynebacterium sp. sy039 TaxID=2599641 RepID=UPI0011B6652B|nr:hypothetical protein [Corynebacterium sp. sy039]QDZ42423.1 hypothetical protein FQV43_04045 [Corynebacterium sp. sy039]